MPFKYTKTICNKIPGVQYINISQHADQRGTLWTVWDTEYTGDRQTAFNLDKVSVSNHNVLRGMHGDLKSTKYISVLHGEVFFSLADVRAGFDQSSFECTSLWLDGKNPTAVLVPPGVVNGFYVQSETAVFFYKWCFEGDYPDVDEQITVKWYDPRLKINWPCKNPLLQERDK